MTLAIVIIAYNRPYSLQRLLHSINSAVYEECGVPLVISIDYQDSENHMKVVKVANDFCWKYGEKKIIEHKENLGLRKHILSCGDLSSQYGGVIILEDDLLISPSFYFYAVAAADYYKNEDKISGISLYSYEYEELALYRFYPINTGYDAFFMQWPSSRGQLWLAKQWSRFKKWYESDPDINAVNMPQTVKEWKKSWKKYFLAYMVSQDKYFVYPYYSFSNEFGEVGTHFSKQTNFNTVNLFLGKKESYVFQDYATAQFVYDAFFELKVPSIEVGDKNMEVEFDLNGNKRICNLNKPYVVSSNIYNAQFLRSFGCIHIPYEQNIFLQQEGNSFFLYETGLLLTDRKKRRSNSFLYKKRKIYTFKEMLYYIFEKIKQKVKK